MRYNCLIFIFCFCFLSANEKYITFATRVLNTALYAMEQQSVIGEKEWHELQLDHLIEQLDRAQTSFGRWGLTQLLHPIANKQELLQRQNVIEFLINNEDVLVSLQSALHAIHKAEKAMLSYWNTHDQLQADCAQFYYSFPFFKKQFNSSALALDYGIIAHIGFLFKSAVQSLCLEGIEQEFLTWLLGDKKDFNLYRGIMNGLQSPLRQHSFALHILKDIDPEDYSLKDYVRAFYIGSLADRYAILSQGFAIDPAVIGLEKLGWAVHRKKAIRLGEKIPAFLAAVAPTIALDLKRSADIYSIFQQIVLSNRALNRLQHRVAMVAQFFSAVQQLDTLTKTFSLHSIVPGDMQESDFLHALQSKHLLSKKSYFYSRGTILQMDAAMVQKKDLFVPMLQSVALLDAYCSIAQLYKEYKKKSNPICFVQFVDTAQPVFSYTDAWLPLFPCRRAITNDFCLNGLQGYPGKIIITGPNGGGKSAILKTICIVAKLAQSWAITFASSGQQTLFTTIRTGLSSHESLPEGLSTFMAEKKLMESLLVTLQKSDETHHALVVIDEPYRGTVDDESAKRIYEFGKKSSAYPYTLMCIATHVKKPTFLAHDTDGLFGNYHVAVKEHQLGHFERLFKLMPGRADWWFEDEEKRGRFIDWIGLQT